MRFKFGLALQCLVAAALCAALQTLVVTLGALNDHALLWSSVPVQLVLQDKHEQLPFVVTCMH